MSETLSKRLLAHYSGWGEFAADIERAAAVVEAVEAYQAAEREYQRLCVI